MSRAELIDVRFAPNQTLPAGYRVVWSENCEHYFWMTTDEQHEGAIHWDRFAVRRGAWAHSRRSIHAGSGQVAPSEGQP